MEFTIAAMRCGHCVRAITQAVHATDPEAHVTIDLPTQRLAVQSRQPHSVIAAALAEAGYPAP